MFLNVTFTKIKIEINVVSGYKNQIILSMKELKNSTGVSFMKIRGEIYNKRSYQDPLRQNKMNILFVEVEEAVQVNGDMIKVLPIVSEQSFIDYSVGEKIEADGEIKFESIVTITGKRCFLPVPVFRTLTHQKVV
jgi:hypothetical protein